MNPLPSTAADLERDMAESRAIKVGQAGSGFLDRRGKK